MTYVYCIMYSIQCILYSVWCIVYNIHYTISSMDPQWMLGVSRNLLSRKSYHMPVIVSRGMAVSARMTSRLAVLLLPVTTGVIVIVILVVYIPPNSLKMKIRKHKFASFSGRSV